MEQKLIYDKQQFLEQYDLNSPTTAIIGQGSYGIVYKVQNKQSLKFYACKVLECFKAEELAMLEFEFKILQDIEKHPFVIKLKQVFRYSENQKYIICIVLDLAEKSLRQVIACDHYNYDNVIQYIYEACLGCLYLKQKKTFHRDIKPDNILIKFGLTKLADFGTGKKVNTVQSLRSIGQTIIGTPVFLSPKLYESFKQDAGNCKHDIEKSDVYSLGLSFLQMTLKLKLEKMPKGEPQGRHQAVNELVQKIQNPFIR